MHHELAKPTVLVHKVLNIYVHYLRKFNFFAIVTSFPKNSFRLRNSKSNASRQIVGMK